MPLAIGMVTIDCRDPQGLAQFWSTALDVPVESDYGDFVFLAAKGDAPAIALQRVAEPTPGKNRLHLDLRGGDRAIEVPRLLGLGATAVAEHSVPGLSWTVMADPEGNVFCVGEVGA
jgi:Glyoxalase-like domain